MRNYKGIGWRAAVLRQLAGLDQAEAAKRTGLTLKTWRNLEAGQRCQEGTIIDIARAFQVSVLWLMYGTADREEALQIMMKESAS